MSYEYRPLSLLIGIIVSAAGWLVLFVLALISWRSTRRKRSDQATIAG